MVCRSEAAERACQLLASRRAKPGAGGWMLAASPPAQTAHQAQGSSAHLPDLRLLATADFRVNNPREQNTRTVCRDERGETPETRQSASHFSLCVDRGPTFDFSLSAWTVVVEGMVEATLASMIVPAVRCARGGGRTGPARQSPVRSRATKNPCHACAHQIVTPPRQRTPPPATPTTRPQLRPCAHLACTSHGTSRQDQRCQIRDAITRCRASAPYLGQGH